MTASDAVVVVGLDAGHDDQAACEHHALEIAARLGSVTMVSVHIVRDPAPHYAAAIATLAPPGALAVATVPGAVCIVDERRAPDTSDPGARYAALALFDRTAGRVIRFPGQDNLSGVIPLTDVTRISAIDEIVCLGATPGTAATLRTQDFVRPTLRDGRLTLVIQPFDGRDEFVPFEQPNPHQCCGGSH